PVGGQGPLDLGEQLGGAEGGQPGLLGPLPGRRRLRPGGGGGPPRAAGRMGCVTATWSASGRRTWASGWWSAGGGRRPAAATSWPTWSDRWRRPTGGALWVA